MQHLTNAITNLVLLEDTNAKEVHGATYASHNEAFGVLAEEVQEADDDLGDVKRYMEHLLRYVRCDDVSGMRDALNAIQRTAVNAAAEAIQVAAVCEKWMDGMQHDGS